FVELFNRGTEARSLGGLSVQYASATGTGNFQAAALPAVSVPPGGSFLVGLAAGTTPSTPLPTPDATGSLNLSGTTGKVALVNSATALACNGGSTPCSTSQLPLVIDLVGYGAANFFEGAPAAATTNSTAAQRTDPCVDTDVNAADFTVGVPAPRSSTATPTPCDGAPPVNTPPAVSPNPFPIEHPGGTTATYPIAVTDDVSVTTVAVDGALPAGVTIDTGTPGTPRQLSVTVDATVAAGSHPIAITLTDDVGATTALDVELTVVIVDACGVAATNTIMELQSSGLTSPLVNRDVRVEGVVTETYQAVGEVGGFYLQDPVGDGDPATSDGVLVFSTSPVETDDVVRLSGRVLEFGRTGNVGTVTEVGSVTALTVCGTGAVAPTTVTLPFPPAVGGVPAQERYEGMRVTMPNADTVTEVFTLGRFGELVITSGDPLYSPTNGNVLGTPEAIRAANDLDRIVLDDARSAQNLYPITYHTGTDQDDLVRVGDQVAPGDVLDGIFTFDFGLYRVQPNDAPPTFVTGIPRPAGPDDVLGDTGDVTVASFNVLNYFTSLDDGSFSGNDTPRGARNPEEFERQQTKIVAGILGLDADVVGLLEIENNGRDMPAPVGRYAVDALVEALNAALPDDADHYAAIDDPDITTANFLGGTFGTDAIKVALIYRPAVVVPSSDGPLADRALIDPRDPSFPGESLFDRPPLVQEFSLAGGEGEPFTVVLNHFKSKGSVSPNCTEAGGLQGNCNDLRVRQARGVLDLVAAADLTNVAIVGDLNSYSREDPIVTLTAAGYSSPVDDFVDASERFSYVFGGELGELDHALVDADLAGHVTGADIWHINSLEPPAADYTLEFNDPALYEPDEYRSSDHDPLIIGLDLVTPPPPGPTCRGLAATKVGTDRGDTIIGTNRVDVIVAGRGNDLVFGLGGDDVICAGDGIDIVAGGVGNDTILGQASSDVLSGDGGNDVLAGNASGDVVSGGPGNDQLLGGPGLDILSGGPGTDVESQDGDLTP
ncbi:MAG: ExeM/NucH family extracellular endonuclease, partial [Ilumatobacteraceae bacterium]